MVLQQKKLIMPKTYTLTLNDGNKKVVNLKKNDDAKNSIDPSTIKQIQIVVK